MSRFKILAAIAGACSLLTVAAVAQQAPVSPTNAVAASKTADFLAQAGLSNAFEIQSGQLALTRSKNPVVLAFARQIVADHTQADAELRAAAQAEGQPVATPSFGEKHTLMMRELENAPADMFDDKYIDVQTATHRDAIDLFQTHSEQGPSGAVRDAAAKILPALKMHLDRVTELDRNTHGGNP